MGKVLYNNERGYEAVKNARSTLEILKIKDPDIGRSDIQNSKILEFCEKGYTLLDNTHSPEILTIIAKQIQKMMEDDRFSIIRTQDDNQIYSRMLNRCTKLIPEIKELVNDDIIEIMREYYGDKFKIKDISVWRNYHIPEKILHNKEIYSSYWHNDDQADWYGNNDEDLKPTKIFISIMNITEKNGPLHIQSKERSKDLLEMGFQSRYEYKLSKDVVEDPSHITKHIGHPGTTIWANTRRCLHRAGNPDENKIRDTIQINFIKSDTPFDDNWIERIEDSTVEMRDDRIKLEQEKN